MKFKPNSTFLLILFVAFAYAFLGALGLTLAIPPGYASPVFPASGLALALVLQFKGRALLGVWLGSFLLNSANSLLHGTFSLTIVAATAVLASGAAIQAWTGSWMVKRWKGESWRDLDREQNASGFLLRGGVLACLMSA
ncbi:MAG: MASE1 domain-containing protein, partial [Spirochaetota bacterium]